MAKKKDTNTALVRIVRDQQVLLDSDLAMLYGIKTKVLNQAQRFGNKVVRIQQNGVNNRCAALAC